MSHLSGAEIIESSSNLQKPDCIPSRCLIARNHSSFSSHCWILSQCWQHKKGRNEEHEVVRYGRIFEIVLFGSLLLDCARLVKVGRVAKGDNAVLKLET